MKEFFNKIWINNPKIRKTVGVIFVIIGFLSVITPFTPTGFFLLIGLEILGIRFLFWDKLKNWYRNQNTKDPNLHV